MASAGLLVMRLGVIATIGVLLFGPSRVPPQSQQQRRPKLSVLLDTSESMLTGDCQGSSRMKFAQTHWLASDLLQQLSRDYDVELNGFAAELHPLPMSALTEQDHRVATGRLTRLADSVTSGLSRMKGSDEGAAMLVISDGRDSEDAPIQSAASLAQAKKVQVYTAALGGRSLARDVAVLAIPMQEYLLPGEPGSILVKVYQSGLDQSTATLRLRQGGQEQSVPVVFNQQRVVEVQLPVKQDTPGQYEYQVELEPLSGEAEIRNNSQIVFCEVQAKRIRVLVLEGQPYWDSKFLAQSLRKDEKIELTQNSQVTAQKRETIVTRVEGGSATLPKTAEEWAKYDVVILGQGMEFVFDPKTPKLLAEFVSRHGGHVIFARGTAYNRGTPEGERIGKDLAVLEPVVFGVGTQSDIKLSLTASGRTSQWFSVTKMGTRVEDAFARLPGFQVMPMIEREKPATIVLARGVGAGGPGKGGETGPPAIVTMNNGRGTVAAVLGEGLWQWSLLSKDKHDLTGFYDTFWSNLVRWLAMGGDFQPGQQVALNLSHTSLRLGDPLSAGVVYKQNPAAGNLPRMEVIDPQGNRREVALARLPGRDPRFGATLDPNGVGVHLVTLTAPGMIPARLQRKFNVYDLNVERLETSANPMPLRMLAEHSGGEFFEAHQAAEFVDRLHRQRASMLVPPQLEYIWDEGWVMFLLLLWAGSEWLLRRKAGML